MVKQFMRLLDPGGIRLVVAARTRLRCSGPTVVTFLVGTFGFVVDESERVPYPVPVTECGAVAACTAGRRPAHGRACSSSAAVSVGLAVGQRAQRASVGGVRRSMR
ncbi:MAG: hypothetical protein ACRDTG_31015 [Pseudonocardiaceae bacterium]